MRKKGITRILVNTIMEQMVSTRPSDTAQFITSQLNASGYRAINPHDIEELTATQLVKKLAAITGAKSRTRRR